MNLNELLRSAGLPEFESESPAIDFVTCDSRSVRPNSLFVVLAGSQVNGARYVQDALDNGAVALATSRPILHQTSIPTITLVDPRADYAKLCAAFYDHPALGLDVIGVTGTNGKTTSTFMIEEILKTANRRVGLIGTIHSQIGSRTETATMTTPGAEDLQRLLREMNDEGLDSVALEVSSHALDQDRLCGCPLQVAAFTSMARDHLDYHQDVAAYHAAKRRLLEYLSPGGWAVLNADAPECQLLETLVPEGCQTLRYSLSGNEAEVSAQILAMDLRGMTLEISIAGETATCATKIVGVHNAANILLASAVAWGLGTSLTDIVRGIESLNHVEGRFEVLELACDFDVLVDYAHAPDAFENMLGTLRALTGGELHVVFGCGGDRDSGKRPLMGRIAEIMADTIMLTDDNPRSENPDKIAMDIKSGMKQPERVSYVANRREAILHVLDNARAHDVVLLAGKGHEDCQVSAGEVYSHSDRLVAEEWSAWRSGKQGRAP